MSEKIDVNYHTPYKYEGEMLDRLIGKKVRRIFLGGYLNE